MNSRLLLTLLVGALLFIAIDAEAQSNRGGEPGPFALTNAEIVATPDATIDSGTIVVRGDSIAELGPDVDVPGDAEVFDLDGMMIYPGLIDSGTQLGLQEIGSIPETIDHNEIGDLTAHMDALSAVNPNSVHIPIDRASGVTTVITEPTTGLIPGTAALINLHGYTPDQMSLDGVELTKLDFPSTSRAGPGDDRSPQEIKDDAEEAIDELNEVWEQAALYADIDAEVAEDPETRRQPEFIPSMNALIPVIRGEQDLMIAADAAGDIESALEWAEERDVLDQVVLSGATEGWRVADQIAEADVPVLAGSVMQPPSRDSDRYDKVYENPSLLHEAGVDVALRTDDIEDVRNLPFHAGFAATYGLGQDEALRAITMTPAEIFGVDDLVGSLEEGKRANFFVTDGDPFEPATEVHHLFIDGYKVPLENRQTRLYDEFMDRTPGLEKHPE